MQEFYQLFTPVDQDVPYTHLRARSCLCAAKSIGEVVWKSGSSPASEIYV